jgi:hypothetical protein
MKFKIKALSITTGLLTATAIFITGIANLIWNGYGVAFLKLMASIYPGYSASGSFGDLIVGTLYGFVDGLVCGGVFGCLYNLLAVERQEKIDS